MKKIIFLIALLLLFISESKAEDYFINNTDFFIVIEESGDLVGNFKFDYYGPFVGNPNTAMDEVSFTFSFPGKLYQTDSFLESIPFGENYVYPEIIVERINLIPKFGESIGIIEPLNESSYEINDNFIYIKHKFENKTYRPVGVDLRIRIPRAVSKDIFFNYLEFSIKPYDGFKDFNGQIMFLSPYHIGSHKIDFSVMYEIIDNNRTINQVQHYFCDDKIRDDVYCSRGTSWGDDPPNRALIINFGFNETDKKPIEGTFRIQTSYVWMIFGFFEKSNFWHAWAFIILFAGPIYLAFKKIFGEENTKTEGSILVFLGYITLLILIPELMFVSVIIAFSMIGTLPIFFILFWLVIQNNNVRKQISKYDEGIFLIKYKKEALVISCLIQLIVYLIVKENMVIYNLYTYFFKLSSLIIIFTTIWTVMIFKIKRII